jgi:hypothetical protein
MLRITVCPEADMTVVRLEGHLAGPWVEELRQACARLGTSHENRPERPIVLTLTDLLGADSDGLELLTALRSQGVEFRGSGLAAQSLIAGSAVGTVYDRPFFKGPT